MMLQRTGDARYGTYFIDNRTTSNKNKINKVEPVLTEPTTMHNRKIWVMKGVRGKG